MRSAATDRCSVAAWRLYDPGTYTGRLALLNAADRAAEYDSDRTLGWRSSATGAIDIHVVPGEHANIVHPPHVRELADRLRPIWPGSDRMGKQCRSISRW